MAESPARTSSMVKPSAMALRGAIQRTTLSTIFIAYYEIVWALGILLAFGLLDYVFYAVMPDVLVCYRCKARYRHSAGESAVPKFNLETHERYRQEEIRLGNTAGSVPSSRSES